MKPQVWVVVFSLLVFGVGYTLGIITVRIADGSSQASMESGRRGGARTERHGPRSRRWNGSHFGSVQRFADELDLNESQKEELERIVTETTEQVASHDQRASDEVLKCRSRMTELLTDEQKQRLDELIEARMESYRREKMERMLEWFRTETGLGEEAIAEIETILQRHQQATGEYFRGLKDRGSWPGRKEMQAKLDEMAKARDEELRRFLDEEKLKQFRKISRNGRRRR